MRSLCLIALLFIIGCSTIAPGNDPVVVRAEQTRDVAVATFDAFLKIEYDNRQVLWNISHDFKRIADAIRKDERVWIGKLSSAIATYKKNRVNRELVVESLAPVEEALRQSQLYLASALENLNTK